MDLARAPRRRPLTARKKGSGYENGPRATVRAARAWAWGRGWLQGGISFSTNQRFCLHFCPKPIRMRKTLHHMKFVNKRMGLLQSFSASGFFGFCHEIDICCS